MLCDDCKKNEACVHITQISPEGKIDKNLCKSCAARYGDLIAHQTKNLSVNDFLKGIFSNTPSNQAEVKNAALTELVCPNCGMTYQDFMHTGKIGCSVCYSAFQQQMEPLLRRIHGSSTHHGKIPHRSGSVLETRHEIEFLRHNLQECVVKEEYEKAAEYRDRIRALEKQLEGLPAKGDETSCQ